MPIPRPKKNESRKDFLARCMSNPVMQEYEIKQRAAICNQKWRDRNK